MIIGIEKKEMLISELENRAQKVLDILKEAKKYPKNKDDYHPTEDVTINGIKYKKSELCIINIHDLKYTIEDLKTIINRINKINSETIL